MPDFSQREFLGLSAAAVPVTVDPCSFSFKNNVPNPLLAQKELPSFKFELERSLGRVDKGSFGKEATVVELPISKGIAGVSMRLEPGVCRELHWHPNADEWQYVVYGDVSVTLFGSHGRYRIEQLHQGDVGHIPQGYGHSIENIGSTVARVLVAFNTGHYQAIDLSQWLASNPDELLRAHFNQPEAVIAALPKQRRFIVP